jgi:Protein of unknown function (DUF2948)
MAAKPRRAGLKLRAEDADDLAVISACLQDAIVPVRDLAYDRARHEFLLVANRFRWEGGLGPAPGESGFERTLCGLAFREVRSVNYRGFRRSDADRLLSLLAIRAMPGGTEVLLEFSGGAMIRLKLARILAHATDFGEPWPTRWQPRHEAEAG